MLPGSTFFRMVRALTNQAMIDELQHGRLAMVVEAVHDAKARGDVTINDIANELGIDQSGASRLVSQAIAAGYIQRTRAERDGRARQCRLTPEGEELLAAAWKWQEDVFNRLTVGWSEEEKRTFVEMMGRITLAARAD